MSAGANTCDADSGRFRLASPVGSELKPEVGDRAAQREFSRQLVRFPEKSPALTRGHRQRRNGSKRASKCREQHRPPPPIGAMRWRSEATETERCAVGKTGTMRCRFAPFSRSYP